MVDTFRDIHSIICSLSFLVIECSLSRSFGFCHPEVSEVKTKSDKF